MFATHLEIFGMQCVESIMARRRLREFREFEVLTMGEDESVDEYFVRTLSIAN